MSAMLIHTDCRYYKGSMPCRFHKTDGRLCEGCVDYDPIKTRILIVKLAAVGDVLRTTSILPPLKRKHDGTHITWVTKKSAAPLLTGNRHIDRVLSIEENYIEFLRNERFDIGICLDSDPHSATIHALAECETRFGFVANKAGAVTLANDRASEWWLMGLNDERKKRNRKTYQQIMYEICDLPLPAERPQLALSEEARQFGEGFLQRNGINPASKIVGINTGGGGRWQYKKWTFEGYVEFIRLLKQHQPAVQILLLGGPEEVELNKRIHATVGDLVVDAGCNNSLLEFSSIVHTVDVLLTSDSLAMHIGVAFGKATLVLVGPTSPWELDVFGSGEILHSNIECLACYLSRCDKLVTCMNTLSPEFVLSRVQPFLN
jgi:heptosyltransferase-2